jgi:phage gp46-like protein
VTDIALKQFDDGGFDIDIVSGDLLTDNGMRTAVLISLFTDRVANDDDAIPDGSDNRRGYWADAYAANGDKIGSRLWLLGREMQTNDTLTRAEEYADEALAWLLADGVASRIDNVASWLSDGLLSIQTTIKRSDNSLFEDVFNFSLEAL